MNIPTDQEIENQTPTSCDTASEQWYWQEGAKWMRKLLTERKSKDMTDLEKIVVGRVADHIARFEDKCLSGYGDVPEGFVPPIEKERMRTEMEYYADNRNSTTKKFGF
jgi:hypothetical protein